MVACYISGTVLSDENKTTQKSHKSVFLKGLQKNNKSYKSEDYKWRNLNRNEVLGLV